MRNHSTITEFILTGLSDDPYIQALLFVLFLVIYLLTMMGNLTMLLLIRADSHLHTPMYFFFIDHAKAFDCVDHNTLENSSRDRNTRPPDLPPEKSVCRSRSNS